MDRSEEKTMHLLKKQREIIFPIVKSYGGEVIKELGDGLLMMFGSAVEAVRFAVEVQCALKDDELTIRAGIHIGDVVFEGGDVFGSAVNISARLQPLAPPNGICISGTVAEQIRNKEDIRLVSLGKKELKGMDEPVEVFMVMTEEVCDKSSNPVSFIRDIWERRILFILAGYVIAAWLIKLAFSFIAGRYLISPNLVELSWVVLLSMIPTVIILTYYNARKPKGGWSMLEKIGLPANLVLTVALVVFLFRGKELGAMTNTITIENEEGEKIERVIPKKEFRKEILLFPFDNQSGDTSLNWIQYGATTLLKIDLYQDLFIETSGFDKNQDIAKEAGYPDGLRLPLALKRKIACDKQMDYFLQGSILRKDGNYAFRTQLYASNSGKLISETEFTGSDIFSITDQMTVKLKKDLNIPEKQIEEAVDLPVSEISTGSEKALKLFISGNLQSELHNDYNGSIAMFEQALKDDPDFAFAAFSLSVYYFITLEQQKAIDTLDNVMNKLYKLPERLQYHARYVYYYFKQQKEKAAEILKIWAKVYPDDIKVHEILANNYRLSGNNIEAINEYKIIASLDPTRDETLQDLGDFYSDMGNYDSAEVYYMKYATRNPQDFYSFKMLGELYKNINELEKSGDNYNKALLIRQDDIDILLSLSEIENRLGNKETAFAQAESAIPLCKSAEDSMRVFNWLTNYYHSTGQLKQSKKYYEALFGLLEKNSSPADFLKTTLFWMGTLISYGDTAKAWNKLKEIELMLKPPQDKEMCLGYLEFYIKVKEPDSAEKYIKLKQELHQVLGLESLDYSVYQDYGEIYEMRKDYKLALENYLKSAELKPQFTGHTAISVCYRELGQLREAEKHIQLDLKKYPYDAGVNYQAALLYQKKGKNDKAREYLLKSLDYWKDADSTFEWALKARALEKELEK
jgi:tetratricopeptide (TPR) repeat protein